LSESSPPPDPRRALPLDPEATATLLARLRGGDGEAMNRLLQRCLPPLRRWAHGRLPSFARDLNDTGDVVQDAVVSALRHLDRFEPRHEGALQAYFRQAIHRRIIDIIRQHQRRPAAVEVPETLADDGTSPLDRAIGVENLARFDAALQKLRPDDQEAIICRLELQYSYDDLAIALDKPSPNAARVAVMRALKRLAEEMEKSSGDSAGTQG
jgi:RNA polymerase sigma-70 factor (ECF subfamily)